MSAPRTGREATPSTAEAPEDRTADGPAPSAPGQAPVPQDGRPEHARALGALLAAARRAAGPVLVQFVKFGIVGISNTLITFAVYTLLLKAFDVWYLAASAIGFIIGATNGFLLNRAWTFRGHVGDSLTPVRWGVVQSCGLALNEALLYLWVDGLGVEKLLAQALALVFVTTSTFFANRAWTFRMSGLARAPAAATEPTPAGAASREPAAAPPP